MTFQTKVDAWLWPVLALLLVAPPALALAGVVALARGESAGAVVLLLAFVLGTVAYLLAWPVTYTLDARHLVVRFGLVRIRIAYGSIREVAPTRNPLSSPAWSLDRLAVTFERGRVLISPARRAEFLRALASRDPGLVPEGDRLVRRRGAAAR